MKKLSIAIFLAGIALASEPKIIPIWPGPPPGSENWKYEETSIINMQDGVPRVSNVTIPTLTIFLPDSSVATGTGVVICPGGGFRWLSMDNEGVAVAKWLNSIGVAAFVLKYRLARTGDGPDSAPAKMAARVKEVTPLAIADGLQAIRVVRARAKEWGVASDRIGIMGFSAGGRVTTGVMLQYDAESRPNFAAPIYGLAPQDIKVPPDAPPIFIAHADDDKTVVPVDSSIRLYEAWKKTGISAELHIYSTGGHGFGMRKRGLPVDTWTERFRDWLAQQGLLNLAH